MPWRMVRSATGWKPFKFQRESGRRIGGGRDRGLLHATTGAGKTYAVWLGAWQAFRAEPHRLRHGLTVLWVTPMRALAADTLRALSDALEALHGFEQGGAALDASALRSGDTASSRARVAKPQACRPCW